MGVDHCELVCDKVAREHPKDAMLGMIDNLAWAQCIKPSLNLHLEFLPSTGAKSMKSKTAIAAFAATLAISLTT